MKKVHFVYAGLAVLLAALLILGFLLTSPAPSSIVQNSGLRTISLDGQTLRISIADTDATRQLGLGGRPNLAPDEGMLFVFPKDGKYAFWMKDMRFSIDILWLSADPSNPSGQAAVVYIAENVSPATYPKDFVPERAARYVLELPAGYCATYNVRVGDKVSL